MIEPSSPNDDVQISLDGTGALFWVPAHLHPALAPGEFRHFLQQHTRLDLDQTSEMSLVRSPSWLAPRGFRSGCVAWKKSGLSKQCVPQTGDVVAKEHVLPRPGLQTFGQAHCGPKACLAHHSIHRLQEFVDGAQPTESLDRTGEVTNRSLPHRARTERE